MWLVEWEGPTPDGRRGRRRHAEAGDQADAEAHAARLIGSGVRNAVVYEIHVESEES